MCGKVASLSRRQFLGLTASALAMGGSGLSLKTEAAEATAAVLPQWHGFNLLEKFMMPSNGCFVENDFAWMAELGFNFARLPMDYRCWTDPDDWTRLREEVLKEIDEAVAFGEKHGLHVCLNFHRAPGYTVAQPAESRDLWNDAEALRVCALHWAAFAKRYQGVPNDRLSFNLFNEPAVVTADKHRRVVNHVLAEIRKHDPNRLALCDGRMWGRVPPQELLDLGVAACTRGYEPMLITHYQAGWVQGADQYPVPEYPLKDGNSLVDREWLRQKLIAPWKELENKGMGVMVGEFGAFNKTPHSVVLSWMADCLGLWKEAGWGWAMWNFRGSFGILDSERSDVSYEDWHGHKLDRAMLDLLKINT